MTSINITLETLYDVLRNEKKSEELQELEKTFFIDVVSYLREKKALLSSRKDEDELFATSERKKLEYEMRSIKRILKEIYEKREKKIIAIALNKSRTGSEIIDTGSMLPEEKEFFEKIVSHFDDYRKGILLQLWRAELPLVQTGSSTLQGALSSSSNYSSSSHPPSSNSTSSESAASSDSKLQTPIDAPVDHDKEDLEAQTNVEVSSEVDQESSVEDSDDSTATEEKSVVKVSEDGSTESIEEPINDDSEAEPKKEVVKIKFLHPVPRFVWKDMKEYGPFESGDETEIYPEIADLLERKGRAQKV